MYYQRSPNIEWKKIEQEILLFSFPEKKFFKLNKLGAFIWTNCTGKNTAEQILNKIVLKFDVIKKKAKEDLDVFLSDLHVKGLIIKTDKPKTSKLESRII